jgi:hypothetical protein
LLECANIPLIPFSLGQVFSVEDVLPACKPEAAAFEKVL